MAMLVVSFRIHRINYLDRLVLERIWLQHGL